MTRKVAIILVGISLLSGTAKNTGAQQFEYGSAAELSGVLWIFVYTGTDLEVRENILKTIRKDLPFIQIATRPEEADAVLAYGANAYSQYYGTYGNSMSSATAGCTGSAHWVRNYVTGQASCQVSSLTNSSSIPMYGTVVNGTGWVIKLNPGGKPRLLMQFSDTRTTILERRPSTNFARNFIKEYRKANPKQPAPRPHPTIAADPPNATPPPPELALFADKARGVLAQLADSIQLQGEWRALLTRRAVPALERLFQVDPRAATPEIKDASLAATGEVQRLLMTARLRLGPLAISLFTKLGAAASDTLRVLALFRDAGALFMEANPNPSDEDLSRFVALCVDKFPNILNPKATP